MPAPTDPAPSDPFLTDSAASQGETPAKPKPPPVPPRKPSRLRFLLAWGLSHAITYVILLLVFSGLEVVFDVTTPEGRNKLITQNHTLKRALHRMQPLSLADAYCRRLAEQHKPALFQWNAPFNADEARRNLTADYPRAGFDCSSPDSRDQLGVPDFWAGNKPCYFREPGRVLTPKQISYSAPTAAQWDKDVLGWSLEPPDQSRQYQQLDRLAFTAANDRFASIPGPDMNSASGYSIFWALVLALPDSYFAAVSDLTPQGPGLGLLLLRIFLILAVVCATLTVLIGLKAKGAGFHFGWVLLSCLLLIPIVISCGAGLLWLLSQKVTYAFGSFLAAPALASTTSAFFTPPVRWAGREIAQHHTVEAVLKRLPKSWLGEK